MLCRKQRAFLGIRRKLVRLLVIPILQPMLQAAQEDVGVAQRSHRGLGQQAARAEHGQRRQRALDPQLALPAAADDLHCLHDEFDLADAAIAELHVGDVVAPQALFPDLAMHIAQAVVSVVVEVLAKHERIHERFELAAPIAGQRARLQPRIAFPRAALGLQVRLQPGERRRQRTAFAVGAQTHVHAEYVSAGRRHHAARR